MATLLYLDSTFMTTTLAVQKLLGCQRTLADTLYFTATLRLNNVFYKVWILSVLSRIIKIKTHRDFGNKLFTNPSISCTTKKLIKLYKLLNKIWQIIATLLKIKYGSNSSYFKLIPFDKSLILSWFFSTKQLKIMHSNLSNWSKLKPHKIQKCDKSVIREVSTWVCNLICALDINTHNDQDHTGIKHS